MEDEIVRHKKRSVKRKPKKSKHKHEYELVEKEQLVLPQWFNYKEVCKICGKVNGEFRVEREK